MIIDKLRKLYTHSITTEKIGHRNKDDNPDDYEWIELCEKEPTYEREEICFRSDVDELIDKIISKLEDYNNIDGLNIYEAIEQLKKELRRT